MSGPSRLTFLQEWQSPVSPAPHGDRLQATTHVKNYLTKSYYNITMQLL